MQENLPSDYGHIFQFENFSRTCKAVLSDEDPTSVAEGEYVTLSIAHVPLAFQGRNAAVPLVLFGLLQHENRMSVVHFRLTMHPSHTTPIKCTHQLVGILPDINSMTGPRSRSSSTRACAASRPALYSRSTPWARSTSLSAFSSLAPPLLPPCTPPSVSRPPPCWCSAAL